jgi:DNA-binding transcriptional LysR family regulator
MSRHASTALASFICAAETGSFAAAAKVLGISAAAVGQNVKRMEDDYGIKLFVRTTRKMALTPEGMLLFERARGPLRELDEIDALFDESRGVVSGVLRVTAPRFFTARTLLPLLRAFRETHPLVQIELDATDTQRDFVDDPVDVAFRWSAPTETTMIARKLADLPLATFASPAYLAARGEPEHPNDLLRHDCLQFRIPTTRQVWDWAFDIDGELQRLRTYGPLTANDKDALISASKLVLGIIQADVYSAIDALAEGELVPILRAFSPSMKSLHICYPSREHLPLRVRAFIDFVMASIPKDAFSVEFMCQHLCSLGEASGQSSQPAGHIREVASA